MMVRRAGEANAAMVNRIRAQQNLDMRFRAPRRSSNPTAMWRGMRSGREAAASTAPSCRMSSMWRGMRSGREAAAMNRGSLALLGLVPALCRALPDGAVARFGKGFINELAFSPDGKTLAVAGSIGIHLYDPADGAQKAFIESDERLTSVAWSPDGRTLATRSEDGTALLWDVSGR